MSSYPGGDLEDLVWDMYGNYVGSLPESFPVRILHDEIQRRLVAFFEPHREDLERRASWYNEDEQSWRNYRDFCLWEDIPKPPDSLFEGFKFIKGQWVEDDKENTSESL